MARDIDRIVQEVRERLPEVVVEQLQVPHPADDDGLWFFSLPGIGKNIQIESSLGECPFIVETDEQSSHEALRAVTVFETVSYVVDYLLALSKG